MAKEMTAEEKTEVRAKNIDMLVGQYDAPRGRGKEIYTFGLMVDPRTQEELQWEQYAGADSRCKKYAGKGMYGWWTSDAPDSWGYGEYPCTCLSS